MLGGARPVRSAIVVGDAPLVRPWRSALQPNIKEYLRSLSAELDVQHSRVRALIGSAHWPTDGHYKEHLLQSLVGRHLPATARIGRGFVVANFELGRCSRELDLLITDRSVEAPMFDEAGVVICTYRRLLAAISVKSSFGHGELADSMRVLASVPCDAGLAHGWGGAYFFDDGDSDRMPETLVRWAEEIAALRPTAFSEVVIRATPSLLLKATSDCVLAYRTEKMATAAFIACLMDALAARGKDRAAFADMAEAALSDAECVELHPGAEAPS